MRWVILSVIAGVLSCTWVVLSVRVHRRDPNWSPRRDLQSLGISAVATIFVALPIAPNHADHALPIGSRIALWVAFWLVLACAIRLVMFLAANRRRLLRRSSGV